MVNIFNLKATIKNNKKQKKMYFVIVKPTNSANNEHLLIVNNKCFYDQEIVNGKIQKVTIPDTPSSEPDESAERCKPWGSKICPGNRYRMTVVSQHGK